MANRYTQSPVNLLAQTLDFKNSIDKQTINTSEQFTARTTGMGTLTSFFSQFQTVDSSSLNKNDNKNDNKSRRRPSFQIKPIKQTINDKFKTFVNWSALTEYRDFHNKIRQTSCHKKESQEDNLGKSQDFLKALMIFTAQLEKKKKREEKIEKRRKLRDRKQISFSKLEDNESLQSQRRERLKKMNNPLGIVHHYQHNAHYTPTKCQQVLINKLVELKAFLESCYSDDMGYKITENISSLSLKNILSKIYAIMNMAVDYNEMRLLVILIILAADVSFHSLDYRRAFYFYRQAGIASDFGQLLEHKIAAFMGMAKITYQIEEVDYTVLFLKKAISYAWYTNNVDAQMVCYQRLGKVYFMSGLVQRARYYHNRYTQNQTQSSTSASKLICVQIINSYRELNKYQLYDKNISLLFIETLSLPIKNFQKYPKEQSVHALFQNYVNGDSPRKAKEENNRKYEDQDFPELLEQIKQYVTEDPQFSKEMPDPNAGQSYIPRPLNKPKREIQFQRSVEYHLIADDKCVEHSKVKSKGLTLAGDMPDLRIKMSLDKQVQKVLNDKPNQNYFADIKHRIKMDKLHKVGDLKERVYKSHLKVRQRKRALSTQSDRIKLTLNKALIDWIDPIK